MAGRRRRERLLRRLLLPAFLLAAVSLVSLPLRAQGPGPGRGGGRRGFGPGAPSGFYAGLSPGRQAMFQRNLPRWQAMSPGEQEFLRRRYEQRREMRRQQAERALVESGLRLDGEVRGRYVHRYSQERRRLERELRRAADAERARRLPEVHERLRREFEPAGALP